MSVLLSLKKRITYGPVNSRRLGRSLGVNLLPPARKWCSFDCLYCQYGWTPSDADVGDNKQDLPSVEDVERAVETALREIGEPPAYLTFSGNGEPTLHPEFPGMVEAVRGLRDRLAPRAKTALLSNASRIGDAEIRRAISRIDRPILKLDAGNERMFHSFNRPRPGTKYDAIIAGLREAPDITLQTLFAAGLRGNFDEKHVADWMDKVSGIRPGDVQIYTLDRAVLCDDIVPVSPEAMRNIRELLDRRGVVADVFIRG